MKTIQIKLSTGEVELQRLSIYDSFTLQKKALGIIGKAGFSGKIEISTIATTLFENFDFVELCFEKLIGQKIEEVESEVLLAGTEWELIEKYKEHPDLKRLISNITKTLGKLGMDTKNKK